MIIGLQLVNNCLRILYKVWQYKLQRYVSKNELGTIETKRWSIEDEEGERIIRNINNLAVTGGETAVSTIIGASAFSCAIVVQVTLSLLVSRNTTNGLC